MNHEGEVKKKNWSDYAFAKMRKSIELMESVRRKKKRVLVIFPPTMQTREERKTKREDVPVLHRSAEKIKGGKTSVDYPIRKEGALQNPHLCKGGVREIKRRVNCSNGMIEGKKKVSI